MKKLLIALLLVLSCVLLFACVQSGPATDTTAPSDESTPGATDTPTTGIVASEQPPPLHSPLPIGSFRIFKSFILGLPLQ